MSTGMVVSTPPLMLAVFGWKERWQENKLQNYRHDVVGSFFHILIKSLHTTQKAGAQYDKSNMRETELSP